MEGSTEAMVLGMSSTKKEDEKETEEPFLRKPSRRTSCAEDATMIGSAIL